MRQVRDDQQRQPLPHSASAERMLPDGPTPYRAPLNEVSPAERRLPWCSDSGVELLYPDRLAWPTPWVGHIPFAGWLIEALQPRMVVELGVHSGNSYCAFLQAIQFLSLSSHCYGIDHWQGDEHSDYYGDDVYAELRGYHDPRYGTFSTLIRAKFEDALAYFSDGSIDLLHIDGFHTYEAVSKDFADWLPKMSARGVVLFHDIHVRERNFGAWRFWSEIAARYPTFSFIHSHGLGVAYLGSDPAPPLIRPLFSATDSDTVRRVRAYFARLGTSLLDRYERVQAEQVAAQSGANAAALESARVAVEAQADTNQAVRIECEKAVARAEVLDRELDVSRSELTRRLEMIASLHGELAAARAEVARLADSITTVRQEQFVLRVEAARALETTSRAEGDLEAARTETARQGECVSSLQLELQCARIELAQSTERVEALARELAAARDEAARQAEAAYAVEEQSAAEHAEFTSRLERLALVEDELCAAREEIARYQDAIESAQATIARLTAQIAALELSLASAHGQTSDALAQRDRVSLLLRQQLATTAALQREVAIRQTDASEKLPQRNAAAGHD